MGERAPGNISMEFLMNAVSRISFIGLAVLYIAIATTLWSDFGYLNLPILVGVWSLLIIAGAALCIGAFARPVSLRSSSLFLSLLIPGIAIVFASLVPVFPVYGTDEIGIDTYAAYLFLHGLNPYSNSNMASIFLFYHIPFYFITPLLKGGYVHYLTYPGLSVLLFVPAVVFRFQSNLILIFFNILSFLILFLYYRISGLGGFYPYAAFLLLLDINWIFYSVGGVTDIVWVVLLSLAYIFRDRVWISGIFFGLAVAFKQTPAVIFPFFLYFIYRESVDGRKAVFGFTLSSILSFFVFNIPFIAMSPDYWFVNVVGIASQPIVGIGMGPSILSFTGLIPVARFVFYLLPALILVALFVLYVHSYDKLKFAFFAFPVFVFFLYYRLLVNYVLYWPYLILLLLPDLLSEYGQSARIQHVKQHHSFRSLLSAIPFGKLETLLIVLIIAAGIIVASLGYASASKEPFRIMSVGNYQDVVDIPDYVTSMNVSIQYHPLNEGPVHMPVYFRIFVNGPVVNANGLLWGSSNPLLSPGINNMTIYPDTGIDMLQTNVSFNLVAYYGNYQSSYSSVARNVQAIPLFVNPFFRNVHFNMEQPIPEGWTFTPTVTGGSVAYSISSGQLNLTALKYSNTPGWTASQVTNAGINLRALSAGNYTLSFNLIFARNSTLRSSDLTSTGLPDIFYGYELEFQGDTKQIWVGYNSSVASEVIYPSANIVVILTDSTIVNFSYLTSIAVSMGWDLQYVYFAYIVGSSMTPGVFSANFNSFMLRGSAG